MDTKYIISQLNKPPFNKNYNFIFFDSLQQDELLQVLSDVLSEINAEDKIEIQLEDPEHTVVRLFNALRILKYKPPNNIDATHFKQGLIQGEKHVVHPILKWLLSNMNELKNRAYLAKFLVKIAIPTDVMGDSDIANLYRQYEMLIEEFTKTHKENLSIKEGNKITTSELISDCGAIEREKEIVSARIDQLKKKTQLISNSENTLKESRKLRLEKETRKETAQQLQEELGLLQRARQQIARMTQQIQELKVDSTNITPNELLNNLGEETYVISYLANEKLPRQLAQEKKALKILQSVVVNSGITAAGNATLAAKVASLSEQQISKENVNPSHLIDGKISLYGQQAGVIAGVKDNLAAKFFELKTLFQRLTNELKIKKEKLGQIIEDTGMAVGEEFQEYVKKLRAQSLVYKRQRGDLAFLKTEANILTRTFNKLQMRKEELGVIINDDSTNDRDISQEDDAYLKNDEDLLQRITEVTKDIGSQKSKIIPLIADIKPVQDECREIQLEYDERKRVYDKTCASFDSNLAKLQQDVNTLQESQVKMICNTHLLKDTIGILKVNIERANNELQMYTEKINSTPTLRERYHRKIAESEKFGKILKEEQKVICANEGTFIKQKQLWNDLYLLLKCKHKTLENEQAKSGIFHLERGSETFILNN